MDLSWKKRNRAMPERCNCYQNYHYTASTWRRWWTKRRRWGFSKRFWEISFFNFLA